MKKILALVCLLVFAAACATHPSGNKDMTANANSSANKSADMKSAAAPTLADIQAKESAGWEAVKKKDWAAFEKLLASDYIEVMDDGVHDRARTLETVKDLDLTDYTLSDWKLTPIDKDAVIITYTSNNEKGTYKGEPFPPGPYREAAAYVKRNGEWVAIYYQETLVEKSEMPPAPPPGKTTPTKTETGPDPIANEKIVWD